jgi:hypothetical protein
MKSLEGIARKYGRKAFLDCAGYFTCHAKDTVEDTIYEMESRFYDNKHQITEAKKFLDAYNTGNCILSEPPSYAWVDMGQASGDII